MLSLSFVVPASTGRQRARAGERESLPQQKELSKGAEVQSPSQERAQGRVTVRRPYCLLYCPTEIRIVWGALVLVKIWDFFLLKEPCGSSTGSWGPETFTSLCSSAILDTKGWLQASESEPRSEGSQLLLSHLILGQWGTKGSRQRSRSRGTCPASQKSLHVYLCEGGKGRPPGLRLIHPLA